MIDRKGQQQLASARVSKRKREWKMWCFSYLKKGANHNTRKIRKLQGNPLKGSRMPFVCAPCHLHKFLRKPMAVDERHWAWSPEHNEIIQVRPSCSGESMETATFSTFCRIAPSKREPRKLQRNLTERKPCSTYLCAASPANLSGNLFAAELEEKPWFSSS